MTTDITDANGGSEAYVHQQVLVDSPTSRFQCIVTLLHGQILLSYVNTSNQCLNFLACECVDPINEPMTVSIHVLVPTGILHQA